MRPTRYALFAALMLSAAPVFAADAPPVSNDIAKAPAGTYELEKSHASITFKAMHMGFANYTMRFNDFDATIDLNPTAPEKSKINVTIRPNSLDSNNAKLTEHTDGKDFFNVAQHPTITFTSTKIEKTSATKGKIHGNLTLLGVTKPIVIDAVFNNGGQHVFFKKYALGFSGTTTIKRSDFGMSYGIPSVSDEVHVAIETEFLQKQ
jgi:polyisoprenoid-binding protein YceI